jgi:hypothetical protein
MSQTKTILIVEERIVAERIFLSNVTPAAGFGG